MVRKIWAISDCGNSVCAREFTNCFKNKQTNTYFINLCIYKYIENNMTRGENIGNIW